MSVSGTNVFMTNTSVNPPAFTNLLTTNIIAQARYQNYQFGRLTYTPWNSYTNISFTNVFTGSSTNLSGGITSSNDVAITDLPIYPCLNTRDISTVTDTNPIPPVTVIFVTNVFCTNFTLTNIVSSTPLLPTPVSGSI